MTLRPLLFSCIALCAFSLQAQAASTLATVNMQLIMHESTAAKSVESQLESKQKSFQAQMSKKGEALQKEKMELDKQHAVLSPDAFERKVKDFKARASAAEQEFEAKRKALMTAESNAVTTIQKSLFDILKSIAQQKGYSAVAPTSSLLYADPSLDITPDVLKQLNATLPSVKVSFDTPQE